MTRPPANLAAFRWHEMAEVYLKHNQLTEAEFDRLSEDAIRIQSLHIDHFRWTITSQILSVYRHIPLRVHYEALAAAIGATSKKP